MTQNGVVRDHVIQGGHNALVYSGDRPADYDDRQNLSRWAQKDEKGNWLFDERYEWDALNKLVSRRSVNHGSGGEVDEENEYHVYTADDERLATLQAGSSDRTWTVRDLNGRVLREYFETEGYMIWSRDYVYREGCGVDPV